MGSGEGDGRESIERLSLRLNAHVGVMSQHLLRHVTCDGHNRSITSLRFSQLCDCNVYFGRVFGSAGF